jgi:hypothetical protein
MTYGKLPKLTEYFAAYWLVSQSLYSFFEGQRGEGV